MTVDVLPAYTRGLNQVATYWGPPATPNVFGKGTFQWPVVIACRWQERGELFRNQQGEQLMSSAVVYPDRVLEVKGYLILGDMRDEVDYLNPITLEINGIKAREIRAIGASPSYHATQQLNKVWL